MTTIAASLNSLTMAADSRVNVYDSKDDPVPTHAFQGFKIWRTRKYIVGCAGDDTDITEFRRWLTATWTTRRWLTKTDFSAILISRKQLFYVEDGSRLEPCKTPYHAIGTGASFALAAMNTMHRLGGDIDPELAVMVACDHDPNSGPPVDVYKWAPIKRRIRESTDGKAE